MIFLIYCDRAIISLRIVFIGILDLFVFCFQELLQLFQLRLVLDYSWHSAVGPNEGVQREIYKKSILYNMISNYSFSPIYLDSPIIYIHTR